MSFNDLNLSEALIKAVEAKGYTTPSPIQAAAIPAVLEGRDVMAAAQTGTGKTAGFTLPLLDNLSRGRKAGPNQARALILTPTRELAAQVEESVSDYGSHLPLKSAVVFGGVKINPQKMKLRGGVDILVATPGRLLDLFNQNAVNFQKLEVLVLDEADRMLDMGFIHDIRKILKVLPKNRQTLMFSATFSEDIRELAKGIVKDPVEVDVAPRNTTVETVKQWIHPVDKKDKSAVLTELIHKHKWRQLIVFSKTKHGANKLTKALVARKITASAIHGSKSQNARTRALAEFKAGDVRVLVATDIVARGLDIKQLPQVVNFDLPHVPEDYVHRIGRTGRAGETGQAISLVSADEYKQLSDIEQVIQQHLDREFIEGYEPKVPLLPSRAIRPPRMKKPKKIKPESEHRDGQRSARKNNHEGRRPSTGASSGGRPSNKKKPNGNRYSENGRPSEQGRPSKPRRSSSEGGNSSEPSKVKRFSRAGAKPDGGGGGNSSPKRKNNGPSKFKGNRHDGGGQR